MIGEVLCELTESGNFKSYKSYIRDPKAFVFERIKRRIQKRLFEQTEVLSTPCRKLVNSHVFKLVCIAEENILAATKSCTEETGKGITGWIHFFLECVKPDLPIPAISVQNIQRSGDIKIPRFHNIVLENMFDLVGDSIQETEETVLDVAMQKIWGCPSNCPFCGEPCRLGVEHLPHKAHSCFEHRPLCVTGIRGEIKGNWLLQFMKRAKKHAKVVVQNCNEMSKSSYTFNCASCWCMCRQSGKCRVQEACDTSVDLKEHFNKSEEDRTKVSEANLQNWHKFKKYKTYLPAWDLEGETSSETSEYWKWFVYNYREELQEEFDAQLSNIPDSWSSITTQKAIESLSAQYLS